MRDIKEIFIIRIYHGSVDYANKLNEENRVENDFIKLQTNAMQRTWNNKEDSIYDKYLEE